MATPVSRDVLNQETDARFWAQTGYKPGQKLDPNNPTDKAMMPVWQHFYDTVKREADAGKLVTTFDNPEVVQNVSDAAVAHKAAAAHLDMAAAAPNGQTAQQNIDAAMTAHEVSKQKLLEAADKQPATVAPPLVQEASKEVANNPPPPQAPAEEHLAHAHAHHHAPAHAEAVQAQAEAKKDFAPPREALYKETNTRFWSATNYKPGQNLNMSDPADREMAKKWMDIFNDVERQANEGTLVFTSPDLGPPPPMMPPPTEMPPPSAMPPPAFVPPPPPAAVRSPSYPPPPPPLPPRAPLYPPPLPPMQPRPPYPPMPPRSAMPPMPPRPSMYPPPPPPPMPPRGRDHEHARGHGRERGRGEYGPRSSGPAPMAPPSGGPGDQPEGGVAAPPPGPSGGPPEAMMPPPSDGGAPGSTDTSVSSEGGTSWGTYLAIGVAVVAGGGLLYYVGTRKPASKAPSRSRSRAARPIGSSSGSPFPSHERPARAPRALPPPRAFGAEA